MDANRLPALVRDYADRVLTPEAQFAASVRIEQIGEMVLKPGAAPRRFRAIEDFAIDRVAFAWKATFPILGPVGLRVTDSYDGNHGILEVRLLRMPLRRARGQQLAQGEAFRYLAEIAWVPHAILANPQLAWRELDSRTVEVSTSVADARVAVRLVFNERGEVAHTVAERPRLEAGGELAPWIGVYGAYRKFHGVLVPTEGEVRWELPEGPFSYWRASITSVERRDQSLPCSRGSKLNAHSIARPRSRPLGRKD